MSGSRMNSSLKNPEPPPLAPFKIDKSTKLEDWKKWQVSFRYYAHAVHLDQLSHDVQLSTFKSMVGPDALKIYNTFSILDITDVESVMRKFDEHFKPKVNLTLERYKLYKLYQKAGQTFDDYLEDITDQVDKCGFDTVRDEILLYKIVGGIDNDVLRDALLADADLKYDVAVEICQAFSSMQFMSSCKTKRSSSADARKVGQKGSELSKKANSVKTLQKTLNEKEEGNVRVEVANISSPKGRLEESSKIKVNAASGTKIPITSRQVAPESKGSHVEKTLEDDETAGPSKEEFLRENIHLRPTRSTQINNEREGDGSDYSNGDYDKYDDDDDDDWRGVDDDYVVVIDPHSRVGKAYKDRKQQKSVTSRSTRRQDNSKKNRRGDPKKLKWRKKNMRKKLYAKLDKHLSCDMCDQTFRMEVSLDKHRKTHLPPEQKDVTCYHCGKIYRKNILRRHVKERHFDILGILGPQVYACDVCSFTTILPKNLELHKFQHTDEKPLACEQCDYKCITPRLLKGHIAKKHTGEMPYPCEVCGKGFVHIDAMKRHLDVHLPISEKKKRRAEKWPCEVCGNVFSSKSSLQTHKLRHSGERPYTCHVCGFKTITSGALSAHIMARHSDTKPFVCNICGYSCKQSGSLNRHMLTHTAEKPFACELCGRRFAQSQHVTRHMLVHTGEKPHVCEICGQRWAQKGNLKAHMKIHQKQSGDPPPRKQQIAADLANTNANRSDLGAPNADGVIMWSEQVTAINAIEFQSNPEDPPQPYDIHGSYSVHQGNPRPADCRYNQLRHLSNQYFR